MTKTLSVVLKRCLTTMNYQLLGQRLRLARERATLTQTEAAKLINVTSAALNQYESGKRRVDALTLERLSRLYGVSLRSLFEGETTQPDWEESLRLASEKLSPSSKIGISRLVKKISTLEKLYQLTETPFSNYIKSPFAPLTDSSYKETDTAIWAAEKARSYYDIGIAPLVNLDSFLEAKGYLIFTLPFGQEENALTGLFLHHPNLGQVIAINQNLSDFDRSFALAHEFAHSFYQYDHAAILCSHQDNHAIESFANQFTHHFLIPSKALQQHEADLVKTPEEVVHLAYYFGVSYEIMLARLQQENKLATSPKDFQEINPLVFARYLGYKTSTYEVEKQFIPLEKRLPRIFLELTYRAIQEDKISLRQAAEMLGISDLELEDKLYSPKGNIFAITNVAGFA